MQKITEPSGKAIYTPRGAAYEYGKVACNFYNGCTHGCTYCYLKRGVLSHTMGKQTVSLKSSFRDERHAYEVFLRELDKWGWMMTGTGLFYSFSTDPLLEETRGLTLKTAVEAVRRNIPVKILTKAVDTDIWLDTLLPCLSEEEKRLMSFGFTLTGRDDLEPGAPSNALRIQAMEKMAGAGFPVFASIEPIIDFEHSLRMIKFSLPYCSHYMIGLRSGVKKDYYNLMELKKFHHDVSSLQRESGEKPTIYWKKSFQEKYYLCPGIMDGGK